MDVLITQANLTLKGGAERIILEIAQHYNAKIYTAEFDKKKTFSEFSNLDVEVIGKDTFSWMPYGRAMQGFKYGTAFYGMKIKDDYDVINAHIAPSHWVRNNNKRVLWYCHTPLREVYDLYQFRMSLRKSYQKPIYAFGAKAIRYMDKKVVDKLEMVVANSNNTKSRIVKYFGRKDVKVLNGAIDYKNYRNIDYQKYFFYPSRISPNKRQRFVIDAFRKFKKNIKGYKLIIAGQVSKDPFYHDYYEKIVSLAKTVGDVKIITSLDNKKLIDMYANCTCVLYSPMNEDYGLVPLEAMASYKPVIAVNEGGPKDTIIDGKTGYLIHDEKEMAKKMEKLVIHPSILEKMGRSGRNRVIKKYSWNIFFKEYDKYLYEVKTS